MPDKGACHGVRSSSRAKRECSQIGERSARSSMRRRGACCWARCWAWFGEASCACCGACSCACCGACSCACCGVAGRGLLRAHRVAAFRRRVHADALEEHRSEQRLRRLPKGDRVLQLRARDGILLLLGALPDLEHGGGEHGEQAEEEADGPQLDVANRGDAHAKQQDEERQLHLVGRAHVVVKIVDRQRHRHDGQLSHLRTRKGESGVAALVVSDKRKSHAAPSRTGRRGLDAREVGIDSSSSLKLSPVARFQLVYSISYPILLSPKLSQSLTTIATVSLHFFRRSFSAVHQERHHAHVALLPGEPAPSRLVKADAIQRERHIHEADGADARQGNLELLELRQVRPGRLEESTRPQQLVEDDGEAKVEEAQRDGEVEACGENLLVDEDNGHRRRHIAKRVAGGDQRVRHVRLAVGSG
eukprot:6197974-Pleurochrysis_carterae.AAC.4